MFASINWGIGRGDVKVAMAMSRADVTVAFQVIDATTRQVVFEGTCRALDEAWGQFGRHAELDFSALNKRGEYFLAAGGAESPWFRIRDDTYSDLPDQLLEFMRQQRCGFNPWVGEVIASARRSSGARIILRWRSRRSANCTNG